MGKYTKEKVKKPWYKRVWVWILIVFILFCAIPTEDTSVEETIPPTTEAVVETTVPIGTTITTEPPETISSDETLIAIIEGLVQTGFEQSGIECNPEVSIEEDILYVKLVHIGIADELTDAIIANNLTGWDNLLESTRYVSESFTDLVKEMGYDYDVTIMLCDMLDGEETVFIGTFNNVIMFDMVEAMGLR